MNTFQQAGLLLVSVFLAISLYNMVRQRGRFAVSMLWLGLWSAAGAALLWPEMTFVTARALGIGRGADFVFYCNVLGTLIGFFAFYLRQRRLERELTLVVRELAIANVRSGSGPGPEPPRASDATAGTAP